MMRLEGRTNYWMGTTIDVHDEKVAQQELEKSLTNFQFLSDMVPHLVWHTDPKGYYDYFNQQWVDYTGYTVEDSLGTDMWNNLLHPDDQQRARQVWNHCLDTGEPYQIEYRIKRASDGMWRWFLARALPLRDGNGNILKWYGTCTDIHQHKQLLDALSQTRKDLHAMNGELEVKNRQLNRINKDLDTIVYAASHDLKSPVNNLEGLLGMVKKYAKEAEQVKIISMMGQSIVRLKSTMAELTEIISVQNPSNELPDLVGFESLFRDIKEDLVESIESTNTTIREDFQVDSVMYPRKYLRSIIFNLLTNAIKYRSSQRFPLIHVTTFQQADFVVIQVSDNGSGISQKDLARLFEIFKRFHENADGTGVGLYLVKKMLDNTGGSIQVSSEVEKGTTFDVFIPIRSVAWPEPVFT